MRPSILLAQKKAMINQFLGDKNNKIKISSSNDLFVVKARGSSGIEFMSASKDIDEAVVDAISQHLKSLECGAV